MKKINIVKKNHEFTNIINKNYNYKGKYYNIYLDSNTLKIYRIGISVPKRIGNAVTRNFLRRQTKDILDKYKNMFQINTDYIIIVKKSVLDVKYSDMLEDIKILITKINIDKENHNEKK